MTPFQVTSFCLGTWAIGLALLVFYKAPQRKQNRLWLIFSLSVAVWGFGGGWVSYETNPDSALLMWRLISAFGIVWIAPLYFHFICHFIGIERPRALRLSYGIAAFFSLVSLTPAIFSEVRYLWGEMYWPYRGELHPIFYAWWSGLIFYSHWELWLHYRKSHGVRRTQIKLFFLASLIGYCAGALEYLPDYGIDLYPWGNFGVALYPLIMSYAILQHHLFDISIAIRRSLVYSLVVTFLTTGYFSTIYVFEHYFQTQWGYQTPAISIVAFSVMAFIFQPLKIGIQRLVDWVVFRVPQEELARRFERLQQAAVEAEKFKAVSTLAAGMAHEIKNPLTALKAFGESIPQRYGDPEFAQKLHEVLLTETERIHALVQDVLSFAKPKTPELKPVDPRTLINSTTDLLSNDLRRRNIRWELHAQHNGATLRADPDQLRQVLINLIQNAADAMPAGGMLTLRTQAGNNHFELAISDTGCGIPKALLPKIFDPFVSTKATGNGLGLAIVHSIVHAHGGAIHADSQPGKGTTFTVSLPL